MAFFSATVGTLASSVLTGLSPAQDHPARVGGLLPGHGMCYIAGLSTDLVGTAMVVVPWMWQRRKNRVEESLVASPV